MKHNDSAAKRQGKWAISALAALKIMIIWKRKIRDKGYWTDFWLRA